MLLEYRPPVLLLAEQLASASQRRPLSHHEYGLLLLHLLVLSNDHRPLILTEGRMRSLGLRAVLLSDVRLRVLSLSLWLDRSDDSLFGFLELLAIFLMRVVLFSNLLSLG